MLPSLDMRELDERTEAIYEIARTAARLVDIAMAAATDAPQEYLSKLIACGYLDDVARCRDAIARADTIGAIDTRRFRELPGISPRPTKPEWKAVSTAFSPEIIERSDGWKLKIHGQFHGSTESYDLSIIGRRWVLTGPDGRIYANNLPDLILPKYQDGHGAWQVERRQAIEWADAEINNANRPPKDPSASDQWTPEVVVQPKGHPLTVWRKGRWSLCVRKPRPRAWRWELRNGESKIGKSNDRIPPWDTLAAQHWADSMIPKATPSGPWKPWDSDDYLRAAQRPDGWRLETRRLVNGFEKTTSITCHLMNPEGTSVASWPASGWPTIDRCADPDAIAKADQWIWEHS